MRLCIGFLFVLLSLASDLAAQSTCNDTCGANRSAVLGNASNERTSILNDPACSLRLVLKSPVRGEELSISGGSAERNFLGRTYIAPLSRLSDYLVLTFALQSDAVYPPLSARGGKDMVAYLRGLEDDPKYALRWSLVFRASPQSAQDDRVALRATWKNPGAGPGCSITEVRLAPSNFTLWCR